MRRRRPAVTLAHLLAGALVVASCAAVDDQPTVAPAAGARPTPATSAPSSATTLATPPVNPSSETEPTVPTTVERTPGEPVPAPPEGSGRTISTDDLLGLVPAELLPVGDLSLDIAVDDRALRATTSEADIEVIVDGAGQNGWLGLAHVTGAGPSTSISISLNLHATAAGATGFAQLEAPYWGINEPQILEPFPLPELPQALNFRVQLDPVTAPITQINVARGPIYLKIEVIDVAGRFRPESVETALGVARELIARIDAICGSTCDGARGALAAPKTLPPPGPPCSNIAPITLAEPPSEFLTAASCEEPHDVELVEGVSSPLAAYPTTQEETIQAESEALPACADAILAKKPAAEDDARAGLIDLRAVLPTPAEFDSGATSIFCVVIALEERFTGRYLTAS